MGPVPRGLFWEDLDAELAQVMDKALAKLREAGVVLVEADIAGIAEAKTIDPRQHLRPRSDVSQRP